jgi:eukaryotic-like serine/threonine-protein kinase
MRPHAAAVGSGRVDDHFRQAPMNQDSERFAQINALLERALEQPRAQQEAFVREASAGDSELHDEVMSLLAFDAEQSDGIRLSLGAAVEALEDPAAPKPGSVIGSWRILRKIAEGGMGMVYLAERADADFRQQAAVKLLPGHRMEHQANLRFAEERRILASLTHPNIARLIDGGTLEGGLSYLVMEYVEGINIDRYCRENALDNAAILGLVLKVCTAVQFAHSKLVVHRDIKPSNILVTAEGEPILLDFGIAKLLEDDADQAATLTRTDMRRFTPLYASPEQVEGGAITTAVDVYALGLLLFLLLTGRLPYDDSASHPRQLEQSILSGRKLAPSEAVDTIDPGTDSRSRQWMQRQKRALRGDLDTIVMMALRHEPERRYPTVAALADDLQRTLQHRPIRARADNWRYRLWRLVRRHPVAVPLSALALVAVVAGSSVFSLLLAAQRDEALRLEARANTAAAFSASLLSRTAAEQDFASTLSIRELLDRAAERVESELIDSPQVALQMHLALAESYVSWGHDEDAISQAERALSLAAAGADERVLARTLDLLSLAHYGLRQLDTSVDYSQRALPIWERIGTPAEQGNALKNIAMGLNALRRRDEAEPVFRLALQQLRKAHGGDHRDIAWVLNNLALCLHTLGELEQARLHFEEALAMQERLGDSRRDLAISQTNLGMLYLDEGDLVSAERIWLLALSGFEAVYGDTGHALVARGHYFLGALRLVTGDIDGALQSHTEGYRLNVSLLGEQHPRVAANALGLAQAKLASGQLDRSEELLRQAFALFESSSPTDIIGLATTQLVLGRVAQARGDSALAETELRSALARLGELVSPDRTPINDINMELGHAIAAQGRRDEGRAQADLALQNIRDARPASDWRRQVAEARVQLPPFVDQPTEAARVQARATIEMLQQRVGPNEPNSLRLTRALGDSAQ